MHVAECCYDIPQEQVCCYSTPYRNVVTMNLADYDDEAHDGGQETTLLP